MPYIDQDERLQLDQGIDNLVSLIKNVRSNTLENPHDIKNHLGRINYCFSRIASNLMGDISYSKIAMITGVLENIKQEFYRRLAAPYEDQKIIANGDISEYLP